MAPSQRYRRARGQPAHQAGFHLRGRLGHERPRKRPGPHVGRFAGADLLALGVGLYALLSGQQLPFTAYLSDLAMGVAGGGIAGDILGRS